MKNRIRDVFWGAVARTAPLSADTFHRIVSVSDGGVWTLFFSWRWQQVWGFKTRQGFKPWREYLGIKDDAT